MTKKSPKTTKAAQTRSAAVRHQRLADRVRALALRISELEEHFREIRDTRSPGNDNKEEELE